MAFINIWWLGHKGLHCTVTWGKRKSLEKLETRRSARKIPSLDNLGYSLYSFTALQFTFILILSLAYTLIITHYLLLPHHGRWLDGTMNLEVAAVAITVPWSRRGYNRGGVDISGSSGRNHFDRVNKDEPCNVDKSKVLLGYTLTLEKWMLLVVAIPNEWHMITFMHDRLHLITI